MANQLFVLFIDANQYLELYQTVKGLQVLQALDKWKEQIFATDQVANEVRRNKVTVARKYLSDQSAIHSRDNSTRFVGSHCP